MAPAFGEARRLIERAIEDRAFPAATVEVGTARQPIWCEAFGRLTYDASAPAARNDTIFDLASLTKVLATSLIAMRLLEQGALGLDDPVAEHAPRWRDRRDSLRTQTTIRDLLAHCSGLPAHAPLFLAHAGRAAFENAICDTRLEYPPRSRSVYSDLGFMLLGFVLENVAPLSIQFDTLLRQVGGVQELQFLPPEAWRRRTAPTRHDNWRGRLLVGEVDDNNAWALDGVAGHAGLFGTVASVGDVARHLLQILAGRQGVVRPETLLTFVTKRADVPGSSRGLGWDTMVPTSSCGTSMSPRAFGHTGFTGTSLWIDPDREVYVVLLTNRVHPAPDNEAIFAIRPALHDAVMAAL